MEYVCQELGVSERKTCMALSQPRSTQRHLPRVRADEDRLTDSIKVTGIKDFRFHDLRHCFASHLIMAGVDITAVKELLEHKTLTMTLRYAHLAPSYKVKAVETLTDTLGAETNYTKTIQFGSMK